MTLSNRITLVLAVALAPLCGADEQALPNAKAVPLMQAIPLPRGAISIRRDGRELTRFHTDNTTQRRSFWFPVLTPSSERSLTRMGHPHDPVSHSHHNSVWISHHDVAGVDFWGDHGKGKGQVRFRETHRLWDGVDAAGAETVHDWVADGDTSPLLVETRRWEWRELGEGRGALLSIAIEAAPPGGGDEVVFGETAFGLIGVRMAKTIGVRDGGGRILNSEGALNEKEVFRKPARWVDYSGPLRGDGTPAGIALLDHPRNPNHPAPFHVREDGWMGVCLSFGGAVAVSPEKPLRARYGLWLHEGVASRDSVDAVWRQFAESPAPGVAGGEK